MKRKKVVVGSLNILLVMLLFSSLFLGASKVFAAEYPNVLEPFTEDYPQDFDNTGYLRLYPDNRVRKGKYAHSTLIISKQKKLKPETIYTEFNTYGNEYTFQTFLYLPLSVKHLGMWYNQSMVKIGNYFYVLYNTPASYQNSSKTNKSVGFIVRYHVNLKKELEKNSWNDIADFKKKLKKQPKKYKKYLKYIQCGGTFEMGHGQTLSTDGKNLYILSEPYSKKWLTDQDNFTLMKISTSNLKPQAGWTKKFVLGNLSFDMMEYYRANTMTFVDSNTFYINNRSSDGYTFYKGTISGNNVKVTRMRNKLINMIGPYNQGLAYNPNDGKLYMVTDSSVIASFKPELLMAENPNPADIEYTLLNTKRELEYLAFDPKEKNKMYLMLTKNPEILVANLPK